MVALIYKITRVNNCIATKIQALQIILLICMTLSRDSAFCKFRPYFNKLNKRFSSRQGSEARKKVIYFYLTKCTLLEPKLVHNHPEFPRMVKHDGNSKRLCFGRNKDLSHKMKLKFVSIKQFLSYV